MVEGAVDAVEDGLHEVTDFFGWTKGAADDDKVSHHDEVRTALPTPPVHAAHSHGAAEGLMESPPIVMNPKHLLPDLKSLLAGSTKKLTGDLANFVTPVLQRCCMSKLNDLAWTRVASEQYNPGAEAGLRDSGVFTEMVIARQTAENRLTCSEHEVKQLALIAGMRHDLGFDENKGESPQYSQDWFMEDAYADSAYQQVKAARPSEQDASDATSSHTESNIPTSISSHTENNIHHVQDAVDAHSCEDKNAAICTP